MRSLSLTPERTVLLLEQRGLVITATDDEPPELVTLDDLKIRTKDRRLITLAPNPVQQAYLDLLQQQQHAFDWRAGQLELTGLREDCLKARQQGISTLWLALYFCDTINHPLTTSLILAHDTESTERLFQIVHRFYEHLPEDKRRPLRHSTRRELYFEDIDSVLFVGTAGNKNVGRGATINNCHMSERALWDAGEDVETAVLEAVPAEGNITKETTANGLNSYYEARQRAHAGTSVFIPRFFGWNLHPEYVSEPAPDFIPTVDEQRLIEAHSLSNGQLSWRRVKQSELRERFPQEYPITENEAFLSSGHPYFDRDRLTAIMQAISHRAPITDIRIDPDALPLVSQAYKDGQLTLYALPHSERVYMLTADTAEGEDLSKGDYDACGLYDIWGRKRVGSLHGKWDTYTYGALLAELGLFYNQALLVIERNNHGWAVIQAIRQARYPEQRGSGTCGLYHHNPAALTDNPPPDPMSYKPGWPTNIETKAFALDKLKTLIEDTEEDPSLSQMFDRPAIEECLRYVHLGGGKAGGEGSAHDDRVIEMSLAAAILALRWRFAKTPKLTVIEPESRYYTSIRAAAAGRARR